MVIQHHPMPSISLVNSSMSRKLINRTNKEFDKCAELLRNILTVQGKMNDFYFQYLLFFNNLIKNRIEVLNLQFVKQIKQRNNNHL